MGPAFASLSLARVKDDNPLPVKALSALFFLSWIGAEYTRYLMRGSAITNGGSYAHIEHSCIELTVEG